MRICYNCFHEMKSETRYCENCGAEMGIKNETTYPHALPCGTVLHGKYVIGRVLGQGGFGITYLAQDYFSKELVAIKEYYPSTMATRSSSNSVFAYTDERSRGFKTGMGLFLQEAQTLSEVSGHPNIVSVHEYFEENGTAYFVMDYVDGESLKNYLVRHGNKISFDTAKKILLPIMDALDNVHAKGIIHRDVAPDNIVITRDGNVKLLDFGAARYSIGEMSQSLDVILKHGFAPKEQYSRHGKQGPYTDVYAMAATFYTAITGTVLPDSIDRDENDEMIPPSRMGVLIPPRAEKALCKALSPKAEDRYQTMQEFEKALSNQTVRVDSPDGDINIKTIEGSSNKEEIPKTTDQRQTPAPNKRNMIIAAVAVLIVILLFAVSRIKPGPVVNTDYSVQNETIIDTNKLFAEVTGFEAGYEDKDGDKHLIIDIDMRNKLSHEEKIFKQQSAINGIGFPSPVLGIYKEEAENKNYNITLPPGETETIKLDINLSDLQKMGVSSVDEIKMTLQCAYNALYASEYSEFALYPTGKSAEDIETASLVDESNMTIALDNTDIKIGIVNRNDNTEALYSTLLGDKTGYVFYVFNKMDRYVNLNMSKSAVNGITCYSYYQDSDDEKRYLMGDGGDYWAAFVNAGPSMGGYGAYTFDNRFLEENSITEISEFAFAVMYSTNKNTKDYEAIFTYDPKENSISVQDMSTDSSEEEAASTDSTKEREESTESGTKGFQPSDNESANSSWAVKQGLSSNDYLNKGLFSLYKGKLYYKKNNELRVMDASDIENSEVEVVKANGFNEYINIIDDKIYYPMEDGIYCCNLDGTNETAVFMPEHAEDYPETLYIYDGWYYFTTSKGLARCDYPNAQKGSYIAEDYSDTHGGLVFLNGKLYYPAEDCIKEMNPDGSDKKILSTARGNIITDGESIICVEYLEGISRITPDGTETRFFDWPEEHKANYDNIMEIGYADGKFFFGYYTSSSGPLIIAQMDKDGANYSEAKIDDNAILIGLGVFSGHDNVYAYIINKDENGDLSAEIRYFSAK